jgi:hypothetical protein
MTFVSSTAAYRGGIRSAWLSVFLPVMAGTYIGLGALAQVLPPGKWCQTPF